MEFKDVENGEHGFYSKSNGKITITVCPVMFGFRIRAGWDGDYCYHLDYCAGAKQSDIEIIYSVVLAILEKQNDFKGFPPQLVKPMYNDPKCWMSLVEMTAGQPLTLMDFPDLNKLKKDYINGLFNTCSK